MTLFELSAMPCIVWITSFITLPPRAAVLEAEFKKAREGGHRDTLRGVTPA